MDPATITALIDLGVKLATAEIERRSQKKLADMNADEVKQQIAASTKVFHAVTMAELELANQKGVAT